MRTALAFCVLLIFCCGVLAQKPKQPSKDEVNEIIRQELERHRGLAEQWKERYNREYETRIHVEAQLSQLRAAVAKAAKL